MLITFVLSKKKFDTPHLVPPHTEPTLSKIEHKTQRLSANWDSSHCTL